MNWVTTHRQWIEFIVATVVLWLMMMVVIQGLDLRTVS
jgi:hypothetical protein